MKFGRIVSQVNAHRLT